MKNGSEKKAGVAILMLDKIELKTKTVKTERRIFRSIRRYIHICILFKKKVVIRCWIHEFFFNLKTGARLL